MSSSDFIVVATTANFESIVIDKSHQAPVLVDFWADWCQPCHSLMPVLAKLAEEYNGSFILAKVNSDEQQELAAKFGVRSLPTVKIFKHGEAVDEFMGALPESHVRQFIEKHINKESDKLREQARQTIEQGNETAAMELLLKAEKLAPDDVNIQTDLAMIDARAGKIHIALARLESLPLVAQQDETVIKLMARLKFAEIAAESSCVKNAEEILANEPDNAEALYCAGAKSVLNGRYQNALDNFFHLMKINREYKNDGGRKAMLEVFKILGEDDEISATYRRKLFNLLH